MIIMLVFSCYIFFVVLCAVFHRKNFKFAYLFFLANKYTNFFRYGNRAEVNYIKTKETMYRINT